MLLTRRYHHPISVTRSLGHLQPFTSWRKSVPNPHNPRRHFASAKASSRTSKLLMKDSILQKIGNQELEGPIHRHRRHAQRPELGSNCDWSPDQYLLFRRARNRPIRDLLAVLEINWANLSLVHLPSRIVDLGCGPGNSTGLIAKRFPRAHITGVDSSPTMLARAREELQSVPHIDFAQADVRTYDPPAGTELLFSNAVFHWLRRRERIPTIVRLLQTLPPAGAGVGGSGSGSGVLALQMPDNYDEPTHRAMRDTAALPGRPWSAYFAGLAGDDRPDFDPIESPAAYYDALQPHCRLVETWTTRYVHVLEGHGEIVEWVRGTGLQPFLNAIPWEEVGVREAFLDEYRRRLERAYPTTADGKVLLMYPRRFVVACR